MKHLSLSLVAATVIALTACSSSKDSVNRYLDSEANAAVQAANKKVEEAQLAQKAAEEKAKEVADAKALAEKKAVEAQLAQKTAEEKAREVTDAKALAEKKAAELAQTTQANYETKLAELEKAKQLAEKAQQDAEKAKSEAIAAQQAAEKKLADIEAAKKAEQDRIAEEKRLAEEAEKNRVATNVAEIKKDIPDNGTFEKTYTKPADPWDFFAQPKDVTINLTHVSGKHITVENGVLTNKPLSAQQDLNTLIIDGKEIALYTTEEIKASSTDANTGYATKSLNVDNFTGKVGSLSKSKYGSDFDQLRYGYITQSGKTMLFIQGHTTPVEENANSPFDRYNYGSSRQDQRSGLSAMPTGEKVWAYSGTAFYGKDGNYQELSVDAIADFGNKKVRADLKEGDLVKTTLGGTINGNQFAGEYNGMQTQGAFYGDQAQDMGGIFYQTQGEDKDKNGVFGATSQGHSWRGGVNTPEKALTDFEVK